MNQNGFEYKAETTKFESEKMGMDMNKQGMYQMNQPAAPSCGCGCMMAPTQTMMCPPIQECPQERVCHRYMCYEVPHIMPCNTRIINHHVYRHTYQPCYTTCEENVVSNVYDRNCCM